jgi:hypothetical protein
MDKYASISPYLNYSADSIKLGKGRDSEYSLIISFIMKDSSIVVKKMDLAN